MVRRGPAEPERNVLNRDSDQSSLIEVEVDVGVDVLLDAGTEIVDSVDEVESTVVSVVELVSEATVVVVGAVVITGGDGVADGVGADSDSEVDSDG